MDKFTLHTGIAAPLLTNNIDTDAIIPSREMKLVSKQGLGDGLFAGWRYTLPGGRERNPEFVLNQADYANTSILLAGDNFGCGSSREHAVWALKEYGIRTIIAPSFGAIFHQNCIRNGILPMSLDESQIELLAEFVRQAPQQNMLSIDLIEQTLTAGSDIRLHFHLEDSHRDMLLQGLDAIALTLSQSKVIEAFEQRDKAQRSWAYLD